MATHLIPDRSCGSCTLCCKLLGIEPLQKPPGEWCPNCVQGRGCAIYETRPDVCGAFYCTWRQWAALGSHWFPADSHLMMITTPGGRRIVIKVDPDYPDAWKDGPCHDDIRGMARDMVPQGFQIAIQLGDDFTFVLPDRDVALGRIADGEEVVLSCEATPTGLRYDVHKRTR